MWLIQIEVQTILPEKIWKFNLIMYVWIVHNFATTIIMMRRKRSLAILSPYEWTKSRKHENIPYIEKDNLKESLAK